MATRKEWKHESYHLQSREIWPGRGQHILAQYDEDSVIVYQAYNKSIADYAVEHGKFAGCSSFGETRMTWIKPNFLWMMFRSKWGSKKNQDHVLAIWLKREAFDNYLENARTRGSVRDFQGTVRLQWDPDHYPNGDRHPYRRAVQLGLKNVKSYVNGDDIICIQDISEFVREQGRIAFKKKEDNTLEVAQERIYTPDSELTLEFLSLSDNNN